ncbi:formyltransferase family protein [Roseivirga seohaensis]|uniref:formyltransferase family protein n=1 Tax=Roseivirga seohaensis TaxID=1914963 RepID=UPI003BA8DF6E
MYRIALVTNKSLHHKYWVSELFDKHNVRLILHPENRSSLKTTKLKAQYGNIWFIFKIPSILFNILSPNSFKRRWLVASKKYFNEYESKYAKIPQNIVYDIPSINDASTIQLIKESKIDIVCFLGGDIAKNTFFESLDVISLNFHSGLSPFYNGNKTIFHCVSDGRPNFAGGTLMLMNEKIDGGSILMSYLVPISKSDDALDLFFKGIIGSVKLYDLLLSKGKVSKYNGVRQERSFKYVRNADWTILNDLKLKHFEKSGRMKLYAREEKVFDFSNNKTIKELYSDLLTNVLSKNSKSTH